MFRTKEQKEKRRIEEHLATLKGNRDYFSMKYSQRLLELQLGRQTFKEIKEDPLLKDYKSELNELYDLIKEYEEKLEELEW